jgi:alkanesulfonate monooxygenase SsuD/methylene tetrahydromethanopterin reductase-like flavin-dependent oxidoreductase (luciferase family)
MNFAEGRFRLGVGVGWNEIEFQGLGADFHTRGKMSEEQVRYMQALWAEPHVTFHGAYHHLDDGGINPRPKSGRVPVWFRRHAEATFRRAAQIGDGFMPNRWAPGDEALAAFAKLRAMTVAAGRKPSDVGIEVWMSAGKGTEQDWRDEVAFWKAAGVTHACVHTTFNRRDPSADRWARASRTISPRSRATVPRWLICCRPPSPVLLDRADFADSAALARHQQESWARQAAYVAARSPLYRRLWDGAAPPVRLEDLAALPLSDKEMSGRASGRIRRSGTTWRPSRRASIGCIATSGTTGTAMNIALPPPIRIETAVVGGRAQAASGLGPGHRVVHA